MRKALNKAVSVKELIYYSLILKYEFFKAMKACLLNLFSLLYTSVLHSMERKGFVPSTKICSLQHSQGGYIQQGPKSLNISFDPKIQYII